MVDENQQGNTAPSQPATQQPTALVIPFGQSSAAPNPVRTFREFLAERGFDTPAKVDQLGYLHATAEQGKEILGFDPQSDAVAIPYFDADGNPVVDPVPSHYTRLRLLQPAKSKYLQRHGTAQHARLTPRCKWHWRDVAASTNAPLMIVEGEFKADRANLLSVQEFPVAVVGLGGVDGWVGKGTPFVPELTGWKWQGRKVMIAFDHDTGLPPGEAFKPGVGAAIERLAWALTVQGAEVYVLHLGRTKLASPKVKMGLDDFLGLGGKYAELWPTAEKFDPDSVPKRLRAKYGIYKPSSQVIDFEDATLCSASVFVSAVAAHYFVEGEEGKQISAARLLLQDAKKTVVHGFAQRPDRPYGLQPPMMGRVEFNLWPGFGHEPQPDAEISRKWCEFVGRFLGPERALLFDKWCAHAFQKPHLRNYTSWFIVSETGGIGKSLLAETVARAAGKVGRIFGPEELSSQYNRSLIEGVLFAAMNELGEGRVDYKRFKHLRTSDIVTINEKFRPSYQVDNFVNILVTSNEMVTHRTTAEERRDIVVRPTEEAHGTEWREYVAECAKLFATPRAARAILAHYLKFQLGDYDHTAPAPVTAEKTEMAEFAKSSAEQVADDLAALFIGFTAVVVPHTAIQSYCDFRGEKHYLAVIKHLRRLKRATFPLVDSRHVRVSDVSERCVVWARSEAKLKEVPSLAEAARAASETIAKTWKRG